MLDCVCSYFVESSCKCPQVCSFLTISFVKVLPGLHVRYYITLTLVYGNRLIALDFFKL